MTSPALMPQVNVLVQAWDRIPADHSKSFKLPETQLRTTANTEHSYCFSASPSSDKDPAYGAYLLMEPR